MAFRLEFILLLVFLFCLSFGSVDSEDGECLLFSSKRVLFLSCLVPEKMLGKCGEESELFLVKFISFLCFFSTRSLTSNVKVSVFHNFFLENFCLFSSI